MWKVFPTDGIRLRLVLFLLFVVAVVSLRAYMKADWEAGGQRAQQGNDVNQQETMPMTASGGAGSVETAR